MATKKKTAEKAATAKPLNMVSDVNLLLTYIVMGFLPQNLPKIASLLIDKLPPRSQTLLVSARLKTMDVKTRNRLVKKYCQGQSKRTERKEYLEKLGLQAENAGMKLKKVK